MKVNNRAMTVFTARMGEACCPATQWSVTMRWKLCPRELMDGWLTQPRVPERVGRARFHGR